jgi:ketosteroid isomerase-like protein
MAKVVRTAIRPNARLPTRRTVDERFFVRWPTAYSALSRAVLRFPPRSRLRRALLRRAFLRGWGAWQRGDLDVLLLGYARDYHFEPPPEWLAVGMRSAYSGHTGLRDWAADMREAWELIDVTPLELIDAGDVLVVFARAHLRARGSGVEFDTPVGLAYWWADGLIVRQRDFLDWDKALNVAGIGTGAVPGARRHEVISPP